MRTAVLALLLLSPLTMQGREKIQGWCQNGNSPVTIPGTQGSGNQKFQRSYPSCTVTVYAAGTVNVSTIYSDAAGTAKANPFTASSDGQWFFYADTGRYDVKLSGGGISTPFTLGDFIAGSSVHNVNDFSGATLGAKIQACHDAATSTGWVCDASLIVGAQSVTSTIAITKPVHFRLGEATISNTATPMVTFSEASTGASFKGCGASCTIITSSANDHVFKVLDTPSVQRPANISLGGFKVNASGNNLGVLKIGSTSTAYGNGNSREKWIIGDIWTEWTGATKGGSAAFALTQLATSTIRDVWITGSGASNNWDTAILMDRGTVNRLKGIRTQSDTVGIDWNCVNPDASLITGGINDWLINGDIGVSKAGGVGIRTDCQFINTRDVFMESPSGVVIGAFVEVLTNGNVFSADNISFNYATAPTTTITLAAGTAPTFWNNIVDQSGAAPANMSIGAVAGGERHVFLGCSRWVNYAIGGAPIGAFTPADATYANTLVLGLDYSGASGWWQFGGLVKFASALTVNAAITQTGNLGVTGNITGTGTLTINGITYSIQTTSNATNQNWLPFDDLNPTAYIVQVRNAANSQTNWGVQKTGAIYSRGLALASLPAAAAGLSVFCTDCAPASDPCTAASNGTWAMAVSTGVGTYKWKCQ